MNNPFEDVKKVTVAVLSREQYERLEKVVSNTTVNGTTTDLQAAHALGVQHVLKILREGFVSG